VKANLNSGVETTTLKNGTQVKGIYIKKIGDGIIGYRLSRINYMGAKKISGLGPKAFCTIDDDKVLADYHSILIPKAIEYSAGLLDYFFRGRFGCVLITRNSQSQQWTITVQNVSGEAFSGGTFTVLTEDISGNRAQILQSPLTGTLADGASIQMTLPSSLTPDTKCIVVYKGTVGLTGGTASDPVDAGIAIVAKKFALTTAPDWSQMSWDTADIGGGASASGFASSETVQFHLVGTADNSSTAYARVHGSLCYTGPGATCKVRINVAYSDNSDFAVMVVQDANIKFSIVGASQLVMGENEFQFQISGGVNSIIEVGGIVDNTIFAPPWNMGLGNAGNPEQEILPGTISVSLTLSNQ
jgi:hypothetical protein